MKFKPLLFLIIAICLSYLSLATASYCYQESANVTNQSGTDGSCALSYTGSYYSSLPVSDWRDGNWTTSSSSGSTFYVLVNYTKPATASMVGNIWQTKTNSSTIVNTSIPLICDADILQLKMELVEFGILDYSNLSCYNGSDFVNILKVENRTGKNAYEEGIYWLIGLSYSNYNLTSANNNYVNNWNTNPRTNATTTDTTPTITFDTSSISNCSISSVSQNYSFMNNSCSGTLSHTCTLTAGNELSYGANNLYVACNNSVTDDGALPIIIKSVPSEPNLTFPLNGTSINFNSTNTWTYLNWSTSIDADNDSVTYKIFVDGIDQDLIASSYCYQESANTSNQTGIDGDCGLNYAGIYSPQGFVGTSYHFQNLYDGDWNTYYSQNSMDSDYLLINYTKPSLATSSSIWQVKSTAAITNISIPSNCWNYNANTLVLKAAGNGNFCPSCMRAQWYCYNSTGWQTIYNTSANTLYEEAMIWNFAGNRNTSNTYFEYSFSTPTIGGQTYNWTVIANDGTYNSTNSYSYFTIIPEVVLSLDGLQQNRTYEYGSTALLSLTSEGIGDMCLSILDVNHGIDYVCSNSSIYYNYTLENYTAIDTFSGSDNISMFFRVNESNIINLNLPTFLEVYSASYDLFGARSPETATYFNDWTNNQTSQSYNFTSNVSIILNYTVRTAQELQSAKFNMQSSDPAYGLLIDVCNDGIIDINESRYYYSETEIVFSNISVINNCVNTSKEFNVIPFNISFTTGGNVTIKNVKFKRSNTYYAHDVQVDVANDGLTDTFMSGNIIGAVGHIIEFNDSTTSTSIDSTSINGSSNVYYFELPAKNTITSFKINLYGDSKNGTFTEDFSTTSHINLTTSTAGINTFFKQATNQLDGTNKPIESWIYSTKISQVKTDLSLITATITDEEGYPLGGSEIEYYFSSNGGTNWTDITSEGTHTIANPGNESYWYAHITSNNNNASYIYSIILSGLDNLPVNFSVDIGNDGSKEYNGTTEISSELTEISIPSTAFNNYQTTENYGKKVVPVNFSFVGVGTAYITSVDLTYSTNDISITANIINSFIANIKLAKTYITTLTGGTIFNTGSKTNISINNNSIVSSSIIQVKGEWVQ